MRSTRARPGTSARGCSNALDLVNIWVGLPTVTVVQPTHRHTLIMRELLADVTHPGKLINDAHLAALSVEHGADVYSADADFGRFRGVRWHDPLRS